MASGLVPNTNITFFITLSILRCYYSQFILALSGSCSALRASAVILARIARRLPPSIAVSSTSHLRYHYVKWMMFEG